MRRPGLGGASTRRPTRLRQIDALGEALAAMVARPARAAVTTLGTGLVVAWFVLALGLVSTAAGQVAAAFTRRLATQLVVTAGGGAGPLPAADPYPLDTGQRLRALAGVVAAGVYWPVGPARTVTATTGRQSAGQPVLAASAGFLAAAGVRASQGRIFGAWAQAHAAAVCVLGVATARALGVTSLRGQPAVTVANHSCAVIGIIGRAIRQPSLRRSVLLPAASARAMFGPPGQLPGTSPAVLIQTRPGAASVVARQVPYALSQARPHQFQVIVPPDPVRLRDQVTRTLVSLFTLAGWSGLVLGLLALASITWLSMLDRTPEFALRRAFGARRWHVALHVIWEHAVLGLLGGLAGAGAGVAALILTARAEGWTPVIAPLTVLPAPLAGLLIAVLAGLPPVIRAARVQPAIALSRSVLA